MEENKQKHQAEKLKNLIEEVAKYDGENEKETIFNRADTETEAAEYIELDVLKLPSRKEVHHSTKKRLTFSIKKPVFRLFFVFTLLIIVSFIIYYFIGEQILLFFS